MSKSIEERIASLKTLSASDIDELITDIETAYDAEDEGDADLDTLDGFVKNLTAVHEFKESGTEAVIGDETSSTDIAPVEPVAETETEAPATVTDITPTEPIAEVETTTTTTEETAAMAASGAPDLAAFQAPDEAAPVVATVGTTVNVGPNINGFTAGAAFGSLSDVNTAFLAQINRVQRGQGASSEKFPVASLTASIPEDRQLSRGDIDANMAKIDAVVQPEHFVKAPADVEGMVASMGAMVASGGYCAPLQVKYDIFGLGSTARPVRDSLPTFGAARGGIRFVAPPKLGDYTDAVGLWTAENDRDPALDGDDVVIPKNKMIVECAAELTAETDAVTLELQFGNLMSRAYPELVQRHNALALVEHARFAERNLLSQISAASLAVTSQFRVGTARDFLLAIARAATAYRNRHRVARTTPLRVMAPEWVLDAMREDLTNQIPGDNAYALADATISAFLAARNVNITWHMDDVFPDQGAGQLNTFPTTIKWWIFAEGTFLFLDGGTLDLGVIRDQELVGTNDYITFVETFEGIAKVGIESVQVTTTTHVAGGSTGTVAVA